MSHRSVLQKERGMFPHVTLKKCLNPNTIFHRRRTCRGEETQQRVEKNGEGRKPAKKEWKRHRHSMDTGGSGGGRRVGEAGRNLSRRRRREE